MLRTQRRGVIPTPEVYSRSLKKHGKKHPNALLHAHAQLPHTLPYCTAIEFMCVVFGTSTVVNAMAMDISISMPIVLG